MNIPPPLGGNMQYVFIEGIFTYSELFTEWNLTLTLTILTISGGPILGGGRLLEGGIYRGFYGNNDIVLGELVQLHVGAFVIFSIVSV